MKKEIMDIVNSSEGELKINGVATLYRWTQEDFQGIVEEIKNAMEKYFESVKEIYIKRFSGGFLD